MFTIFIKRNEVAITVEDDEAKVTWAVPHHGPAAPGDVTLTEDQARELYGVLHRLFRKRPIR